MRNHCIFAWPAASETEYADRIWKVGGLVIGALVYVVGLYQLIRRGKALPGSTDHLATSSLVFGMLFRFFAFVTIAPVGFLAIIIPVQQIGITGRWEGAGGNYIIFFDDG